MTREAAVPSKQALVEMIRDVAGKTSVTSLSRRAFLERSGLSQHSINKHFDTWSDACRAAGISPAPNISQTPSEKEYTDTQLREELRRVADLLGTTTLSSGQYRAYGRISSSAIARRFGGWRHALAAAGLECSPRAAKNLLIPHDRCVSELQRVAGALGQDYLTAKDLDEHGNVSSYRVTRVFGSWHSALNAAGLQPKPNSIREVPLEALADDFLQAAVVLGRVPTLVQLTRRSHHVSHTFAGRHGGYDKFKSLAIDHLFSTNARIPPAIRALLATERTRIVGHGIQKSDPPTTPHRQGRTLNFRAFVYSPTSEHDVVQMFGAVAHELGFEIVGNRSAFPDCEARRRAPGVRENFVSCLIEYEYASSDFRRHGHPSTGCDLVVCWENDWKECPVEVLELKSEIRRLSGWS